MRILVISDVHANLAATEAVFAAADEQGVKDAWCLGDLVGYGKQPDRVVSLVRSRCSLVLAGNHDLAVAGRTPVDWFPDWLATQLLGHRRALSQENLEWLASLEPQLVGDGRALFHASPSDAAWGDLGNLADARRAFAACREKLLLVGHTHRPLCFFDAKGHGIDGGVVPDGSPVDVARPGFRFICNPGAVGTRNGEDHRACYAILDAETMHLTYHRLDWRSAAVRR